jgi:sterol desaturase/sphingolipid hydroxylase (fatty acid hydroxylase superfamily)
MTKLRDLTQRFLNYSINPRQYWGAVGINVLLGLAFAWHLALTARWAVMVWGIACGVFAYTFGEYAYHRWIAHGAMWRYMAVHHDAPDRLITAPWFAGVLFVLIVWPGLAALTSSPVWTSGMFLGATVVHLYADVQHVVQHRTATRRFLRPHHLEHHQNPTVNFGLTTRVWDRVFGTLAP